MSAEIIRKCIADHVGASFCNDASTFAEMGVGPMEMLEIVDHLDSAADISIPYSAFNTYDMLKWTIDRFTVFALGFIRAPMVPDEL